MNPICDVCSQPELPPLPPVEKRILDNVRTHPGISTQALRDAVWWDDPDGLTDRKYLHVCVSRLNALLRPLDVCVRSEAGCYWIRRA